MPITLDKQLAAIDPEKKPRLTWSLAASTFFSNWINYAVYQETPYDLAELD